MARLVYPDESSRLVYRQAGAGQPLLSAAGGAAQVYVAETGSTLADLQNLTGGAISSVLVVDSSSRLPLFKGPDGVDTVWISVDGGPRTAVYARQDDQVDQAQADASAALAGVAGKLDATTAASIYLSQAPGVGLVEGATKAELAAVNAGFDSDPAERILRGRQRTEQQTRVIPSATLTLSAAGAATSLGAGTVVALAYGSPDASFTATAADDLLTVTGHGLKNGDTVVLRTIAAGAAGLTAATRYFAKDVTANTFKLAATFAGPAIDITTDGNGTIRLLNNLFRYSGCIPFFAGVNAISNEFVQPSGLDSTNGALPMTVEFHTDSLAFEVFARGVGNNAGLRVVVDGEAVPAAGGINGLNSLPGPPANGSAYRFIVNLPASTGVRNRHVRLEGGQGFNFGAIIASSGRTVSRCSCPQGPRAIFLGDSFVEGTIGGDPVGSPYVARAAGQVTTQQTLAPLAGKLLGWHDTWASGSGGTGYLNPGSTGRKKLRDRVQTDAIDQNADVVVVAAGINDASFPAADVGTEAGLLFDAILTGLPYSTLVVVGPFWPRETSLLDADRLAIRDAIKAAAQARSIPFIDPIAQDWITAANKGVYTGSDGTHPSVLGHEFYARRIAANIAHLAGTP